ncbi:MAG TPA: chorismate mutase [candidate division Zixibacteria bacterium]|nr:chorismate mutase [candidate division Zixibacteria bacterium]
MSMRGIRGATQVVENSTDAIISATRELLSAMVARNDLKTTDIVSAFFTVTTDLNAAYPAAAARAMGWTQVPLLDAQEIEVPGGMPMVIRVLLHVETPLAQDAVQHVYLGAAAKLRTDLTGGEDD